MNPMMTQNLGQRPGRARLGACARRDLTSAHLPMGRGCRSASWHLTTFATAVDAINVVTMAYVGSNPTGHKGFGSTKRPARHLGSRST